MSIAFGRTATQDLTHVGLTLAPRKARAARRLGLGVLVAAAVVAGAGAGYAMRDRVLPDRVLPVVVPAAAAPAQELQALRQQLEQARMGMRVSEARSHELERQIDALHLKLTESQDELTFFRKAREGKKH